MLVSTALRRVRLTCTRAVLAVCTVCLAPPALAHEPQGAPPHLWSLDPLVWVPLAVLTAAYALGLWRLGIRSGVGRGVPRWRAACFAGALLTLFLTLVWPLEALAARSFALHMLQHMLLIALAAPLLVLGAPEAPLLHALPPRLRGATAALGAHVRRSPLGALARPVPAMILHALAIWGWHLPQAFEAALRTPWVHAAEHASFLGTGLLFWWSVRHTARAAAGAQGLAALAVLATLIHTGLLGALLTFAGRPLYATSGSPPWGLSALEDQQLAGLIMWVPGGVLYLAAGLALVAALLRDLSAGAARRQ
jgi:putative membrane protein